MTHAVPIGNGRTFTVHWSDLAKCLPIKNDDASKARRRELFDLFDPQGHGILHQAKVVRALFRMMPQVAGFSDIKLTIHQAWGVVRDMVTPITSIGVDKMDRNQFRVLCVYLWYYFKLWDIFAQLNEFGTGDRKVSQRLFEEMLPSLSEWGIQEASIWTANPDATFLMVDRTQCGWAMFDDFAAFVLRRSVPQLAAAGEEEERQEAIRLLRRTHPHLLAKEFPKKDRTWNGAAPPIPPPGQKRPPMPIQLSGDGLEGGAPSPNRRFKTQYMCDYMSPKYLPSEVTTAASTPARSRNLTRASTPKPARPPSDLMSGIALIRSASMPDQTMRTQGLDRNALRSKLENHLDMYSTGQMRKLLKVAGGMVVGPPR